ncbi:MAG TPA: mannose-1-phosphate guanylyltransferase/mannose-6-phosphate isomerase [Rhodanobacteraceae bacterium]|nr:mannose-1-phosphate guanylyltransferase/mannose-6-phosphate isomerase [Rhodanobacteraceae bacterium]
MSGALQPVILSGGSGTRLWPASRESYPKQLLALFGEDSMLQSTVRRLDGLAVPQAGPIVVGNEDYRFIVAEQMRLAGIEHPRLVLEPAGRNTAPALTLAALVARSDESDPVLLVMPADHVIAEPQLFRAAVEAGLPAAQAGAFVTFGIEPTRAETGYGYIRRGGAVQRLGKGVLALQAFVEKPDAATARQYLESGEYFWNSGIFMLRASTWLRALQVLQPAMLDACSRAMEGSRQDGDFLRPDKAAFAACPSDSIDYAVMEKLHAHPGLGEAVVIPLRARWSDVGAWEALWEAADKDSDENVVRGDALLQDTRNSLVLAGSRLLVALGCEGMVVVDTPDAVLVADKGHTPQLREVVAKLKEHGREELLTHRKVYRPWGWYDSIEKGPHFQVKRIGVNPGASLSLQMHHRRAEHWVVVRGLARVTRGDDVFDLRENESVFIPLGTKHRLQNRTGDPLEIIEVQCGDYLGEDDIVRFEDVYARA